MAPRTPLALAMLAAVSASPTMGQVSAANFGTVEVIGRPVIEGNRIDAFGSETTVVTDRQVEDLNAPDLASALRRTPGVTISRFNPVGAFGGAEGGAIFIRGLGASRPGSEIKTYVDGVPFYMGVWNHPLLDLLPINGMASITVEKGPQPQNVGNNLSSVNLTTKPFSGANPSAALKVQGGSFSTFVEQADGSARLGSVDLLVAQGYQSSNGDRPDADGRIGNVLLKAGTKFNREWSGELSWLGVDNRVTDPGPEGQPELKNGVYKTKGSLVWATLRNDFGTAKGDAKLYWSDGSGNWYRQSGTTGDTLTSFTSWGARIREGFAAWTGGEVVAGIDYDNVSGNVDFLPTNRPASSFDGPRLSILSPYVAVNQRIPVGEWEIVPSAGLRYYDSSDFSAELAPNAGIVARKDALTLYANYARGVNYPGLDVVVFSQSVIPGLGQSWRNLSAETLDHYQVGVGYDAGNLSASLALFYDKLSNRYVFVPPPPPPPVYANIGGSTIKGLEATVQYEPNPDLSVFGGVTLLDPSPATLPYAPKQSYVAGLSARLGAFRFSVDAEYVGSMSVFSQARANGAVNPQSVDAHFLLNARVFHPLPSSLGRNSEVFLALDNITNEDYTYRPGYPMPGFAAMAGVTLRY